MTIDEQIKRYIEDALDDRDGFEELESEIDRIVENTLQDNIAGWVESELDSALDDNSTVRDWVNELEEVQAELREAQENIERLLNPPSWWARQKTAWATVGPT